MKVSYIICYSSTWPMTKFDPTSWQESDLELDKKILNQTNKLLQQIYTIPGEKEIILIDNSGDFILELNNKNLKIIEGFGALYKKFEGDKNKIKLQFNEELKIFNISDKIEYNIFKNDQAQITALAYNQGIAAATGDYIIMQHNDTKYLFDDYSKETVIYDAVKMLIENDYEYLSIDKKELKSTNFREYNKKVKYCADCYWFLCRRDFFTKHNIWIDWNRGDNNHLATFTCANKNLKYKHLPGFYEGPSKFESKFWADYFHSRYNYKTNGTRFHLLYNKPFLEHMKGGTGLRKLKDNDFSV